MARPHPYSLPMVALVKWAQKNLARQMKSPCVLACDFATNNSLLTSGDGAEIQVLDRRTGRLTRTLQMPPRARTAFDFRKFVFSDDGVFVAGYNPIEKMFAVWSMSDGDLKMACEGAGQIAPAMVFMPGGRIVICDGPRISTHMLTGELLHYTPTSDDLRSIALFAPPNPKPFIVAVGVFRKGLGGHQMQSMRIENGIVTQKTEGPIRARPDKANVTRTIEIKEAINVPGLTARILVINQEERFEVKHDDPMDPPSERYITRLSAVDPAKGAFYSNEVTLEGRHCLEVAGAELHVVDEMGRFRRIAGFPFRLEEADWRLVAS